MTLPEDVVDPEDSPRAELAVLRPELRQELLLCNTEFDCNVQDSNLERQEGRLYTVHKLASYSDV